MSKSTATKGKKNPETIFTEKAVLAVSVLSDAVYMNIGENELSVDSDLNDTKTAFHRDIAYDRWKKRDIFGPKGATFIASVMKILVEDYKNSKNTGQHKFIDAVRDYCSGFRHFESTYYFYKGLDSNNQFVRTTTIVFDGLTDVFLSDASDNTAAGRSKAKEVAVLCASFLVMVYHNISFVSRAPIKVSLYEELVRKLGMEGLFTGVPELREQFKGICVKLNEVTSKKKPKTTASNTPTDSEGQKTVEHSGQIKAIVEDVIDAINDNDEIDIIV